jgi:hypothetical protein
MHDRVESDRAMLAETREDVKHADQKASLLLAAVGVGLGALLSSQLQPDAWRPSQLTAAAGAAYTLGLLLSATSVLTAGLAVWPRYDLHQKAQYGYTYWGHIAGYRTLAAFEKADTERHIDERARTRHQLWELSRLTLIKYRMIRTSLTSAGIAALALVIAASL